MIESENMSHPLPDSQPENRPKTDATPARVTPGKFRKGVSGNPGGRPRAEREVREMAQRHGRRAIKRLVELLDSGNERVCVAAASVLLDRGFGKAPQAIVGANGGPLAVAVSAGQSMTPEEAYRLLCADATLDPATLTIAEPEPLALTAATEAPIPGLIDHTKVEPIERAPLAPVADPFPPKADGGSNIWEALGK